MLSLNWKKILLGIHIFLVSTWIGTLITILIIHHVNLNVMIVDKMVFKLFDILIINISIVVAVTGLLFSTFTQWGFLRFWWIITKWLLITVLAVLIIFFAAPAINGAAAISDVLGRKALNNTEYMTLKKSVLIYTWIQLIILTFIVFLSTIKPWGRRNCQRVFNRKLVITAVIIGGLFLITSSMMQYFQLVHYRNLPIEQIDFHNLGDGYYSGEFSYGYDYKVAVLIKDQMIENVEILQNRDSFYARLAEGIKLKIIRQQKNTVESVTGATTTSKVLLKAIENALKSARK